MENSKKSFVSVLKCGSQSHVTPKITKPALVLDETCIKEFDFGMSLIGREKDVYAIPNLPCIISKEGFQNVKLSYLGGMWVLFDFDSLPSKEKFLNHSDIGSWFTELIQAISSFENDERIVWISIEGLPIKAWTPNTFRKVASLWGEYVEREEVDLKYLSRKHLCLKTNMKVIINERQKVIIQGKVYWIRIKELDAWFPNFHKDDQDDLSSDGKSQEGDVANKADNNESNVDRVSESSFMHENDTAHKDAKQRWIKELCQKRRINFVSIQETKAESISLHTIKNLWGNKMFNHVVGSSVGCSGGILCMWNPNMFVKEKVSTCDYFVALMGTWAPTFSKLLIISVYAPQELNKRRDLWDYLRTFIGRWEGDTVILGDFNEVRSKHERFGSTFNMQGAIAFNNFISSACLIDLPLEGYASTWAHKSASKMSKLDRYLISEGVLDLFPHLSALCLDRHLSDHRPILLRETNYDYGPSPFWVVWDCGTNKSRGPDGFSFEFYRKYWTTIDDDVFQAVRDFFLNGHFPRGCFKINLHKSKLTGIGVSSNVVAAAASLIRCSILTTLFNYLGVKWVWRFLTDGSSLCTRFIKAIFGNKGALDTHKLIPRRSPWQDVILAIHSLQSKGEVALKVLYKKLYALEMCKSISVADKMGHPSLYHSICRMPKGGVEQENYGLLCLKVADLVLLNISDR
nr:RNA-directed DNA polymerase, eukaryota [Tanacetum cinerariifolium]